MDISVLATSIYTKSPGMACTGLSVSNFNGSCRPESRMGSLSSCNKVFVDGGLRSQLVAKPFVGGSQHSQLAGQGLFSVRRKLQLASPRSPGTRGIITMVIPFQRGTAWEQLPPDLASFFKSRIVYLGRSLVPAVTELIMAELLYLQYDDPDKPIYMYINSTGTTKDGEKLGYETEAFVVYDTMGLIYVWPLVVQLVHLLSFVNSLDYAHTIF